MSLAAVLAPVHVVGGASAQTEAEVATFLRAVQEAGCVITAQTAPAIEQRSGLSQPVLAAIMQSLIVNQQVSVNAAGDQVTVLAGPCAR